MPSILVSVAVPSIYKAASGGPVPLPKRLALAAPDMKRAIADLGDELSAAGGRLVLSDLFRSYDMQVQAHLDYVSGRKKAYSPPAGGSLHEAGRAFDLDLSATGVPLKTLWQLCAHCGLVPIIAEPDPRASEAWHFEHRGSHQIVYDHYKAGRGTNFDKPYRAMAASAIVSIGVRVDVFEDRQSAAYIQSGLLRLGVDIGNLDGQVGPRTRDGLKAIGLGGSDHGELVAALDDVLQRQFPEEFFDHQVAPPIISHA